MKLQNNSISYDDVAAVDVPMSASHIKNCLINSRGEALFIIKSTGEVIVHLDGYAIIPREQYEARLQ